MNVRQLRFFLQIAEIGSVTRAATFLHIAQPALSRQIRHLEEELGVTLFQRSASGVALTDAGQLLRDRAAALLRHFERVRSEVRDEFNEPSGELTMAMPPSMSEMVTQPTLVRYRAQYPNVLLRVYEGISGVLNAWSMVQMGRADLAIVTNIEPLASLESSVFLREPLCLIGPKDAQLDSRRPIDLQQAADRRLIVPSRPNTLRLILETAMAERKLPLDIVLEANTPQMVLAAVQAGFGFGTLPYCGASGALHAGRVSLAPIEGIEVIWTFIQSRDQPLSTAGEHMKALLRQSAVERINEGAWPAKMAP